MELVEYLIGSTTLNYVGHRDCVHGTSAGARKERNYADMTELDIRKELRGSQERNLLHRAMRKGRNLALYPIALTVQSYLRRNSGITSTSYMG